MINRKAQVPSIIAFIAIAVALFLLAPILLRIMHDSISGFSNAIGGVNSTSAQLGNQTGMAILSKTTGMFDYVIVLAFAINILVLLVSAFLVDIHPVFVILYIMTAFFALIFSPTIYASLDAIWNSSQFSDQATNLPITAFILNNFGIILMSVIMLSGIIMYAKFKYGRNNI